MVNSRYRLALTAWLLSVASRLPISSTMSLRRSMFWSTRTNRRSASTFLALNREIPAASSKIPRRSLAEACRSRSTLPCSIRLYASTPTPVPRNRSLTSLRRQGWPLMAYSPSPLRKTRRLTCTSSASWLKIRVELSRIRTTSALLAGLRPPSAEPLKITSAISAPRKALAL